jgi:CRISPR-associated protein (TIGR03986 family)
MTNIRAPYNFVPLNKAVVTPYWVPFVSHDVPFEDGLCGEFEVVIKAESPIFVKDGMGQEEAKKYFDQNGKQIKPFRFNHDAEGRFFVPGSSTKGMVSNVLEVLSFGGILDRLTERKYALRDLSGTMKDQYLKDFKPDKIYCGWLKKAGHKEYIIEDCGFPGRISHREIEDKLGVEFSTYFSQGGRFNAKNDKEKSAQKKYELFSNKSRVHGFEFEYDSAGRLVYTINEESASKGTLVFTGQPGHRKQVADRKNGGMKWTGHHLEFIFWNNVVEEHNLDESVSKDFFDANYEYDKTQWSEDWKVWRNELENNQSIPVFFSKDDKGKVLHLGLSYLYKLPYKNAVQDAVKKVQLQHGRDLAEAIFGYIDKEGGLKGRVHFGHAYAVNTPEELSEAREVLAGPKASYFPNYIRQDINNGRVQRYNTFMDEKPEISGWKRYPVHHRDATPKHNPPPQGNDKVVTRFKPLAAGAEFKFTIRYHNLKPIELGALLSALTFHNTQNTFHSLGMGKPLGYGKVKLSVQGIENKEDHLLAFECYMNVELKHTQPEWHILPQVQDLVTMAQEHHTDKPEAQLEYMKLDPKGKNNEFVAAKNEGLALDRYPHLVDAQADIHPMATPECIAQMKHACEAEEIKLKNLKPLDVLAKEYKIQLKKNLAEELARQKQARMAALHADRLALAEKEKREEEELEAQKRVEAKAQRQAETQGRGLDLSDIKASSRNAFDDLKKAVEKYTRDYHGLNDTQLKAKFPEGYLPERDHDVMLMKVTEIHNAGKGPRKDVIIKKVAGWIGEERANSITFK